MGEKPYNGIDRIGCLECGKLRAENARLRVALDDARLFLQMSDSQTRQRLGGMHIDAAIRREGA